MCCVVLAPPAASSFAGRWLIAAVKNNGGTNCGAGN
jgi:hypothetical protein